MPSLIIKAGGTYTMSGKYMKIKRVIIPTLTMVMISSMLFGVTACGKKDTYNMLQESTEIELEYAVPDYDNTEESKVELLPWLQLASLETHPELRTAFEELVGVTGTTGNKEGILYTNSGDMTDQNNTLLDAMKNTTFRNDYLRSEDKQSAIETIANNEYTDIEDNQSISAVINAYFELLPDQADGQFDGDATISRAQAMTLVMRATTPVNDQQAPDEDEDFTKAVGETQYTNFAAPMDEYTYLNTENGLNDKTFNTTMSRGEYIYLLTKSIFSQSNYNDYLDGVGMEDESLSEDVKLTTVKDGGDISLQDAVNNVENGLPTDMYQTLARAVALGFITEDNLNWDEAITKSEAINLFIDAVEVYQTNMEEVNNKMFGLDGITASEDKTSSSETASSETSSSGMNSSQPYYPSSTPCGNSQKQQAWDNFCNNWNESDYGTTTAGKCQNDFPYYGRTGYDSSLLEYRTTDKGYTVMYDTATGRVYYTGMTLPTGDAWDDTTSGGVISQYIIDNNLTGMYDLTYAQFQELLGTYAGD